MSKIKTKHSFVSTLKVDVPVEKLFSWHENPGAYERLPPAFDPVTVKYRKGSIDGGDSHSSNLGCKAS